MSAITSVSTSATGWSDYVGKKATGAPGSSDITGLVQFALRQAYLQNQEDLALFAEKVKFFNKLKKAIRGELNRLRNVQSVLVGCYKEDGSIDLAKLQEKMPPDYTTPGGDDYRNDSSHPDWGDDADGYGGARRWVDEQLRPGWGGGGGVQEFSETPVDGEVHSEMGKGADEWWTAGGKERLDNAIANLEEQLSAVGDDAQLANVDLQNGLQRMQQTLQMLSNIGKVIHDTAMNTIRKIGG